MAVVYLLYFVRRIGFSTIYPGHSAEQGLIILLSLYTAAVAGEHGYRGTAVRSHRAQAAPGHCRWGVDGRSHGAGRGPAAVANPARRSPPVLGIGFGMYLSIDQALVTQVLPAAGDRARSLGVISVASSAGQAVAPALAAPVVTYMGG